MLVADAPPAYVSTAVAYPDGAVAEARAECGVLDLCATITLAPPHQACAQFQNTHFTLHAVRTAKMRFCEEALSENRRASREERQKKRKPPYDNGSARGAVVRTAYGTHQPKDNAAHSGDWRRHRRHRSATPPLRERYRGDRRGP